MEEKDRFPIGITYKGKVHTQFTLREQIVADGVEVIESKDGERALASDAYYGICLKAKRLAVDGIPAAEITPALVMQMHQADFDVLVAADSRLSQRRLEFRTEDEPESADLADPDADGVQLGPDPGDARGDSGRVAGGGRGAGDTGSGEGQRA